MWPFDPIAKQCCALVDVSHGESSPEFRLLVAKGAVKALLACSNASAFERQCIEQQVDAAAARGQRLLAVSLIEVARSADDALAEARRHMSLVSLFVMHDPPRTETAATISPAKALGIDVKMITGTAS